MSLGSAADRASPMLWSAVLEVVEAHLDGPGTEEARRAQKSLRGGTSKDASRRYPLAWPC
jgi:hypothetical protein